MIQFIWDNRISERQYLGIEISEAAANWTSIGREPFQISLKSQLFLLEDRGIMYCETNTICQVDAEVNFEKI